jgi:putative flippase GtrA
VRCFRPRLSRYAGASGLTALWAQAALAFSYGVLALGVVSAVAVSLAVSVGPSYILNSRWVWSGRSGSSIRQFAEFVVLAVTGSAVTAMVGLGTEHIAGEMTSDRGLLTVALSLTAVVTTGLIWAARFVLLNRFVFVDQSVPAA